MPNLFPYQREGRKFLIRNQFAFLADQPGLGKTPQAIMAAEYLRLRSGNTRPTYRVYVICPKSAVENWKREYARWGPLMPKDDLKVVHYDALVHPGDALTEFQSTNWDIVIIDEAHRLKTPGAKRTHNIYHTIHDLKKSNPGLRVWLLSGTPAKNHTGELWTHLRVLRPDLIFDRSKRPMTQEQFEEKFCRVGFDAYGCRRINGSKNVKELRQLLFDGGFLLRRRKSEVQQDLPELIFSDYPLPGNPLVPALPNLKLEGLTVDDALQRLRDSASDLAGWRNKVAQLKIPIVKEFVETELEVPGEKLIVFFHHTILGRELYNLLGEYQPVIVDGKTKVAQDEVDTFQNDPNCRVFLGQIATCQEALNITAATQVAFAEAAWSPSDNFQAACRAHRYGMGENLVVRFLSLANSPDELVQTVLARKTKELAELLD